MPALPTWFRTLVRQSRTPLSADSASALRGRPARDVFVIVNQAPDLLGDGVGTLLGFDGVTQSQLPTPLTAEMLRAEPGFSAVLNGTELRRGHADAESTHAVQRALQTVGARVSGADDALLLPTWGADGDYGNETTIAVKAFQTAHGIDADGVVGKKLAEALLAAVADTRPPNLWADVNPGLVVSAGAREMVDIARGITSATADEPFTRKVRGRTYSYTAAHFGVKAPENGRLRAPGNVSYGLRTSNDGYWKCNIFGGTCVALAELPVPLVDWSGGRHDLHFPLAERFGPSLARKRGWTMVRHLDHRDPEDETTPLVSEQVDEEILELLRDCLPGDLLFVDHPGLPGTNGGHTRVVVETATEEGDPRPLFAQASQDAAILRNDGLDKLGGGEEIQFWLVRYTD